MYVSARAGDTLTVIRGSLGTTAAVHDDDTPVYLFNDGDIYDTGSADADNLPNETICLYYDNIKANPRRLVSCDVYDKKIADIELGDIIQFLDANVDAFGKTWGDLYFMVVEEYRSKDKLSIVTREVYAS